MVPQRKAETSRDDKATAATEPDTAAGLQLTPWLRLGSLRDQSSKAAEHALMPALRRCWR